MIPRDRPAYDERACQHKADGAPPPEETAGSEESADPLAFLPYGAATAGPGSRLSSRPVAATDLEFLCRLYRSTRWDETAATGWADEERAAFLDNQFHLQHRYYQEHYADAQFRLLLQEQRPIGRVYWRDGADAFTLIDISLVPEARGAGIGSAVMAWMTHRADQRMQPCRLHVEPANPARRLYERIGFEVVANNGVHLAMRRTPGLQARSSRPRHEHADLAQP